MSVQLFVAPTELRSGILEIAGAEHHYLSHVRRLEVGDQVLLFDGQGSRARAKIVSISGKRSQLEVAEPEEVPPPAFALRLAPALIKGERMDQAIGRMVELGVSQIHPLTTERTIVRLKGDRAAARHQRFMSLVRAAARQSQNPRPAVVHPIASFDELLRSAPADELKLIPCAYGDALPLAQALPETCPGSAMVLIGPEGGFTPAEVEAAEKAGFVAVSLGERILRAETACTAVASILGFRYGDVGRR